jgi:hypothetical protein
MHAHNRRGIPGLGTLLLAAAVPLVLGQMTYGQGVGPPLGGNPTTHHLSGGGWTIPDLGNPRQPVIRDPNGPPWPKILTDVGGAALVANPGATFFIHERLIIDGTRDWADWHEEILDPGWEWNPAVNPSDLHANGVTAPGLNVNITPGTSTQGGIIDFTFNSLPPGTLVDIYKTITYSGAGLPVPAPPFQGHIRILEYPTPEPGSALLLGAGGLVLLRSRKRSPLPRLSAASRGVTVPGAG